VKIEIRRSFEKDAIRLPGEIKTLLYNLIHQINIAKNISEIPSCKKLTGFKNANRVRMGSYRNGHLYEE